MSGVACNGDEISLSQCTYSIEILTECPDNNIAGVVCQGITIHCRYENTAHQVHRAFHFL